MKKTTDEYAIFTPHGQMVLFCVPILLLGLPIALIVSFLAPQLPLFFGLTGRHSPVTVFGAVMLVIVYAVTVVTLGILPGFAEENFLKLNRDKDMDFLVSTFKKNPSMLRSTIFLPKPFMCSTGQTMLLQGIGDQTANPLALRYQQYSRPDSGNWKIWYDDLENEINKAFSELQIRADVDDKLLVVKASFVVNKQGEITNLEVQGLCPEDFHLMIITALKSIQGNSKLTFPDQNIEDALPIMISGRFSQNYGPKFLERKKEKPSR
ncbi:MAG: hypothetical protein K8F91_09660 [Candidatus Obscuribacterales bacterium]|nr:hypothetical protein [Candidatus Obscuribacterales bacterium]